MPSYVTPSHLSLFPMPTVEDITAHLLAQDVVWVTAPQPNFIDTRDGVVVETQLDTRKL